MTTPDQPHYLLISECKRVVSRRASTAGKWRFVLEELGGATKFEACDVEPGMFGERLELLAVVRGLEALDQPSRVTLLTASRYVNRGFRYGLSEWRDNHWRWERFGQMVPVKHADLWKRIDGALRFHSVQCRLWQFTADQPQPAQRSVGLIGRMSKWWKRACGMVLPAPEARTASVGHGLS